jgi:hypothetical protein
VVAYSVHRTGVREVIGIDIRRGQDRNVLGVPDGDLP